MARLFHGFGKKGDILISKSLKWLYISIFIAKIIVKYTESLQCSFFFQEKMCESSSEDNFRLVLSEEETEGK